ncbi:outer membrane protein TolC [Hydrogenispora ethanolica]|uniref:Outer membrane protein TolC n=1 Tax=Hydrogenispora ethanolica TaxID=1082276 RepID=A0A4V2QFE2_HYDET|nr:TolC family protein [Hydrogenispora ethanolica]TCL71597.1 outer membrane protein TolC [Hydrogenispora ethanolica]
MFRKVILCLVVLMALALPANSFAAALAQPETLTLNQCIDLAFQNNQQIKLAAKNVAIAQEAVKEAEAGFMPSLSYEAGYSQADPAQYQIGNSLEKTRLAGGITGTLPLFTGGKLENALKLAKIKLESAKEDERKAKQTLTYNVKQAYYNVWLADQVLKVNQSSYDNLNHHVQQVQNFYKVGTSSKFDLLRAEVQRDTIKPKVIASQNQLALAKLQLATTIGLPKEKQYTVAYDVSKLQLPASVTHQLQQVLDAAYQDRPEIRQMHQSAEISKVQTELVKAGYKPDVALSASYSGAAKDFGFDGWKNLWSLTIGVKGDFGFTTKPKIAQAKGNEELIAIKEADLKDQIRLDAEQSLQNLAEGIETTRANQANIDLAKESLRLTQARFDAGLATTMDIMDAQLALDQALSGYYQGVVSYLVAEAKIDLVVGK